MTSTPPTTAAKWPRRGGQRLGALVAPAVGPAFAKRGFASADLTDHWPEIVGAGLARQCRPLQLFWPKGGPEIGATLTLAATPAFALDIQQMSPVIIERLNRRLGWRAVTRITIKQRPVTQAPVRREPEPPSTDDREEAGRIVAGITSDPLRAVMARLGSTVLARTRLAARRPG